MLLPHLASWMLRARPALLVVVAISLSLHPANGMPPPGGTEIVDPTVSGNTGAATFQIPIDVPPGPRRLAPNLALVYSSLAGAGAFGIGWRLNIQSEIGCSLRSGVPSYDPCDRFELDGQLLTYDGTERYHTFVEDFRRIKKLTDHWEVTSLDGTTRRYGVTANARVEAAPGQTARWLLEEVEDTFGNTISLTYDRTDLGAAYPSTISYAGGERKVTFVYEPRPDTLRDFQGGVERILTKRLREVQVTTGSSSPLVFQRRVFGYDVLAGAPTYSTIRSRMTWTQLFGTDCTTLAQDPKQLGCVGLPEETFEYTDPNDELGSSQATQYAPSSYGVTARLRVGSGSLEYRNLFGDIDGDGLVDKIENRGVKLNDGTRWPIDDDPLWQAALDALQYEFPRMTYTYRSATNGTELSRSLEGYQQQSAFGICAATLDDVTRSVIFSSNSSGPTAAVGFTPPPEPPSYEGEIVAEGRIFLTDVDADGLADVVVSTRLSGVHLTTHCQTGARLAQPFPYVAGKTESVVFRNTGRPQDEAGNPEGWVRDNDLAKGLPPFGEVAFAGGAYTIWQYPAELEGDPEGQPCYARALAGLEESGENVCFNEIDLVPQFADFNGDGYLDVMVLERDDPAARGLWVGASASVPLVHPDEDNIMRSRVWVQDPDAPTRWVRDKRYDLPVWDDWFYEAPLAHARVWMNDVPFPTSPYAFFHSDWPATYTTDVGMRLADLNGDGLADVIWKSEGNAFTTQSGVLLNTGKGSKDIAASGWCGSTPELAPLVGPNLPGGPGLECSHAGDYLPADKVFATTEGNTTAPTSYTVGHVADLNGDRLVDFLFLDGNTPQAQGPDVAVAAWLQSPGEPAEIWSRDDRFDPFLDSEMCAVVGEIPCTGNAMVTTFSLLDANGDGAADVVGSNHRRESVFDHADLVRKRSNGRGGTIELAYEPDVLQRVVALEDLATAHAKDPEGDGPGPDGKPNGEAEPVGEDPSAPSIDDRSNWTTRPVVSQVTVTGHGFTPTVTEYRYADPRWCPEHRSGFGFRLVESTRPDGSTSETYFWQKHGRAGRLARLLVKDAGSTLFQRDEDWELPQALVPGSMLDPEVFVGRRTSTSAANQYGTSDEGSRRTVTIDYSDVEGEYGYNVPLEIAEARPTGLLRIVVTPQGPNLTDWLIGLPLEQQQQDAGGTVLSRTGFTYIAEGAVATRTDYRRDRGSSDPWETVVTSFDYDARGNPVRLTEQLSASTTRDTYFCYDGTDPGYHGSCPVSTGPETYSVRTGIVDVLGNLTSLARETTSGRLLEIDSFYADEPTLKLEFDAFSRLSKRKVRPEGAGSDLLLEETVYGDVPYGGTGPAHVEQKAYTGNGGEFIRTARVSNGFDGVWKTIRETLGDPNIEYVGTAVHRDASQRLVRETYPTGCDFDAFCSTLSGLAEDPAVETRSDALGRPIEISTPDGTSRRSYGQGAGTQPAGPATTDDFDVVLASNGKGDLVERWMDGARDVWVKECANGVDPGVAIDTASCSPSDDTFYTYEATGEISTIYDAIATATGGTAYTDPSRYLRYHYDTLGRVRQIDDPDGGTTTTAYDDPGNVAGTGNARGDNTVYTYDVLDRPLNITPLSNGELVQFSYRADEFQQESEATGGYELSYEYDDRGRLARKTHEALGANGFTLLMDFAYDRLGRTTQIVYPDDQTAVNYGYESSYLVEVCEVDDGSPGCGTAVEFYVTDVTYDDLGRPLTVSMPSGDRTNAYSGATQRLTKDRFDASGPSSYWIERDYGVGGHTAYDETGNLVDLRGGTSESGDPTVGATYAYDRRNRLASWTRGSTTQHYSYDTLGNLTGYAIGPQDPANQVFGGARPHAVTSSSASGATVTYAHDADGNLESALGGPTPRHFSFDWANRLTGVGSAPSSSNELAVGYDARGSRMSDLRGAQQRIFFDEHFTAIRDDFASPGFDRAKFHVFAFGETLAYKFQDPITLRSASSSWLLWVPGGRAPDPWLLAMLGLFPAGALLLVARRYELHTPLRGRPVTAGLAWSLVLAVAIPPVPAGSGGGGGTTARRWLVTDHLGSGVVWVSDEGARVRHTEYAPFGKVHEEALNGGLGLPRIYAGHHREPQTGLDYMGARWCSSETGTFLGVDPLVADVSDPQSHNAYSYARNNPIRFTDPTGALFSMVFGSSRIPFIDEFTQGASPGLPGGIAPGPVFGGGSVFSGLPGQGTGGPILDNGENPVFPGSDSGAGGPGDGDSPFGILITVASESGSQREGGETQVAQADDAGFLREIPEIRRSEEAFNELIPPPRPPTQLELIEEELDALDEEIPFLRRQIRGALNQGPLAPDSTSDAVIRARLGKRFFNDAVAGLEAAVARRNFLLRRREQLGGSP